MYVIIDRIGNDTIFGLTMTSTGSTGLVHLSYKCCTTSLVYTLYIEKEIEKNERNEKCKKKMEEMDLRKRKVLKNEKSKLVTKGAPAHEASEKSFGAGARSFERM